MANTFKAEIDRLRSAYEAAVATGDLGAMSLLLEEGAVFVRPGAPEWEAMAASAPGLPFPPGAKIAISPIEVVELSKNGPTSSALPSRPIRLKVPRQQQFSCTTLSRALP
jgi:hypothetical protein